MTGNNTTSTLRRWLKLTLGLAIIWAILFVFGPASMNIDSVKAMSQFIEDSEIESGALYWTDVEVVGTAEANIRATIKYPPKGP